jgi:hypothetical protein
MRFVAAMTSTGADALMPSISVSSCRQTFAPQHSTAKHSTASWREAQRGCTSRALRHLVQRLLALIVAVKAAARLAKRVQLVDENDTRCCRPSALKESSDASSTPTCRRQRHIISHHPTAHLRSQDTSPFTVRRSQFANYPSLLDASHADGTRTDEYLDEVTGRAGVEGHSRLARHRLRQQRLASTRGPCGGHSVW